jgi:hypothetical protein
VASFFSEKTGGSLFIDRINLNTKGGITLKGLMIHDPDQNLVSEAGKLQVSPNLWSLFLGNPVVASAELEDAKFNLEQQGSTLNVDFMVDAFGGDDSETASEKPGNIIQVGQVSLQQVAIDYTDLAENTGFQTTIGSFTMSGLKFSTAQSTLDLSNLRLSDSQFLLIYPEQETTDSIGQLPPLDLNTGLHIKVNSLVLENNQLEFHKEEKTTTSTLDWEHLVFERAAINISDLVVSPELLSFKLQHLATELSGFHLHEVTADIHLADKNLKVSELQISFEESSLYTDLQADYDSWELLLSQFEDATVIIDSKMTLVPENFKQLPLNIPEPLIHIPVSQVKLSGLTSPSGMVIDSAWWHTDTDTLNISGKLSHFGPTDSLYWTDLTASGYVGNYFSNTISQLSPSLLVPKGTAIGLTSNGSTSQFNLDGVINFPFGDLTASGAMSTSNEGSQVNLNVTTDRLNVGRLIGQPWLGSTNLSASLTGNPMKTSGLKIDGDIYSITVNEQQVEDIEVDGILLQESLEVQASINDLDYLSDVEARIDFTDTLSIGSNVTFDDFFAGSFMGENGIKISGRMQADLLLDPDYLDAQLSLLNFDLNLDTISHQIDSLWLDLRLSDKQSSIIIAADDLSGELNANFNLQQEPINMMELITKFGPGKRMSAGNRKLDFTLAIQDITPIKIIDQRLENLDDLRLSGHLNEAESSIQFNAYANEFKGFGLNIDSFNIHFEENVQTMESEVIFDQMVYNDITIGDLAASVVEQEQELHGLLSLDNQSGRLISLSSLIKPLDQGLKIHLDSLSAFGQQFQLNPLNTIQIHKEGITIDNFHASHKDFDMEVLGNEDGYLLVISEADLTNLNLLLPEDSVLVNRGTVDVEISYLKNALDLDLGINDLVLGNSPPLKITAFAESLEGKVPFVFQLNNESNQADLKGAYSPADSGIEAVLALNVNNLEVFQLFFKDRLEQISGRVVGNANISGTIQQPVILGTLRFQDVDFTTLKPVSSFHLEDELLKLDNQGIVLDNFTIYDQLQNPLVLDGILRTQDYQTFDYDFRLVAENYWLINNPKSDQYQLQGNLVVGSNLEFKGNEKDTYIDAEITIRDTTELSYRLPEQDLDLLSNEGIVEFVDPNNPTDTLTLDKSESFYDSIMATLPSFNLKSRVLLEEKAVFRVITNPRSGDFVEVSGTAALNFDVDGAGNVELNGTYQVNRGFYQLSFYDLVKKRFDIASGSSVTWEGNPDKGILDIKALHNISSSSIGLIGHEIAESERELYRTALPYEVGIIIKGTIDNPEIIFSLDLPKAQKTKFPVLANKLERLTQPEFESELNKQVFGLLVLGGFIPDDSGSDLDQSLIATTAISNSVNSILASQLNRFAGQLIKGVDINVGLQSYSDFTSSGSQTRTAMDFRVTKRMMNDRLSIEVGGGMDINSDQSGANTGTDNFRGDITVIYDLTESGNKKLKMFNNETYDIIYHEIRNTGISLIFIKDFDKGEKAAN